MFCQNCGNQIADGEKFCKFCGCPVKTVQQQEAVPPAEEPAAPQAEEPAVPQEEIPAAPVQEETYQPQPPAGYTVNVTEQFVPSPNGQQPVMPQQPDGGFNQPPYAPQQPDGGFNQPPYAPQQPPVDAFDPNYMTQPAAPKKGLSKGAKLAIILSCAGAALAALILVLVFVVFIPMMRPAIDVSKYLTIEFNTSYSDGSVTDGAISGEVKIDEGKLVADYPAVFGESKKKGSGVESWLDFLDVSKTLVLESTLYQVRFSCSEGDEAPDMSDYRMGDYDFEKLSEDSVLNVTVSWGDDSFTKESIKNCEDNYGVRLETAPKTVTLKIADELEKQNISVKESVELDLLKYIEENELIVSEPVDDKNISPALVPFTAKLNGYIVTADYLGDTWLDVTDSNENFVTTINLTYDKMTDLKAGDTVTLSYDDYNGSAEDAGIILKGTPVSYTIAQPIKVNAETAAKNVAAIKEYYAGKTNFDNYADEGDQLEIADVYYVTDKTTSSYQKIVYIEKNVTKNYYIAIEVDAEGFFSDGQYVGTGYFAYNYEKTSTAADAVKKCAKLNADSKSYQADKLTK